MATSDLPSPPRRQHRYTLGDVLEFTGVARNRLMRWLDAAIIKTAGGGSQGKRREFSFRNLVEVAVCDELRGLGMSEALLRVVVENLNTLWDQPDDPLDSQHSPGLTYRDATILWIAFERLSLPGQRELQEGISIYPIDEAHLVKAVTSGEFTQGIASTGIAVPLRRIITDLERTTGDSGDAHDLDADELKKHLTEKLRDVLKEN